MGQWRNKHYGEIGLIIGNAPSLRDVPDVFLTKYPSFGSNWIMLRPNFVPTYYVAVDPSVIRGDYLNLLARYNCPKFIGVKLTDTVEVPGCYPLPTMTKRKLFVTEAFHEPVWEGWSVTYVALQIAYFMGFRVVLLVGVDHRYTCGEQNHFHPDYEKDTIWKPHDMTKALAGYEMARAVYEADGRRIINLTPGSDLKVFEPGYMADW